MEKEIVCLDTSVLIEYYRKKDKTQSVFFQLTQSYRYFAVSSITEFEVYSGSTPHQDAFWDSFFDIITILPFDDQTNKIAIELSRELRKKNKQISIPDLFIGATAIKNKMPCDSE